MMKGFSGVAGSVTFILREIETLKRLKIGYNFSFMGVGLNAVRLD